MTEPRYVLWGSAGHAKVLASILRLRGAEVAALFDNDPRAKSALPGVRLFVGENGLAQFASETANDRFVGLAAIGGGRGRDRLKIHELFRAHGIAIAEPLVHPRASICDTARIGAGTQVLAHSVVAADSRIGEACIVNHMSNVDHEAILGDGTHLAPGVTLCGCVTLGVNVFVGAGAIVLPRLTIGANTVIGAGAVVTRDLPSGVVAVGNPARIVREIEETS